MLVIDTVKQLVEALLQGGCVLGLDRGTQLSAKGFAETGDIREEVCPVHTGYGALKFLVRHAQFYLRVLRLITVRCFERQIACLKEQDLVFHRGKGARA